MQPIGDQHQNPVEKALPEVWIDCLRMICALVNCNGTVAIRPQVGGAEERLMLNFLKSLVAVAAIMSATAAEAGGPVIIEEGNDEVVEAQPARSGAFLPIIGVLVLACLVVCGDEDEETRREPPPPPK
jgi:hypothetical protein